MAKQYAQLQKMNGISWMIVDNHVPLPNSASNVKFGFALDEEVRLKLGYFRCEI